MEANEQAPSTQIRIDQIPGSNFAYEILRGVGVFLGLGLLWGLEIVRNGWFHILDRANFKPRRKRASAFPPGEPIKRQAA